jgi:hypothetical protein
LPPRRGQRDERVGVIPEDITIGRLVRLCEFYRATLAGLVPLSADVDETEIVHIAERRILRSPDGGIDIYRLAPDADREMMLMLLDLERGSRLAARGRHHRGEEWVCVVEGRLCLSRNGPPPRCPEEGERAYYRRRSD